MLRALRPRSSINLYGPTETTIWSAVDALGDVERRDDVPKRRRSAVRSGTRGFMCWTAAWSLFRLALSGELYIAGRVLRAAI